MVKDLNKHNLDDPTSRLEPDDMIKIDQFIETNWESTIPWPL